MEDVMPFLHKIYEPLRLSTILHKAQLIAFLTSSTSSNNNFLMPVIASGIFIFCKPEMLLDSSPKRRVASRRMLTTLQCINPAAIPTMPCRIMLPIITDSYTFLCLIWSQLIQNNECAGISVGSKIFSLQDLNQFGDGAIEHCFVHLTKPEITSVGS